MQSMLYMLTNLNHKKSSLLLKIRVKFRLLMNYFGFQGKYILIEEDNF